MARRSTEKTFRANRCGFTLLEMIVVIAIVALLATVALLSLREPYRAARFEDTVERIALFERQLRDHARRFGRAARLTIDLQDGHLSAETGPRGDAIFAPVNLSAGVEVDRVRLGARTVDYGRADVAFTRRGQSPTYALRMKRPGASGQWLLFAGMTGQMIRMNDDEINDAFDILSAERTDAP